MSDYEDDALDNVSEKGHRDPTIGEGRTRIEVVEVTDRPGQGPKSRGALVYRISGKVISCVGPAAHYEGQRVAVIFMHGVGSAGYDAKTGTSYGDVDIKGFLIELVKSTNTPPPKSGWGPIGRGVSGPAQTARGMVIDVIGFPKPSKDGSNWIRHRFEAVPGQVAFGAALLAGPGAPVTPRTASAPAAPGAPTPPRPPAPPAAEHPMADEVRKQAAGWAASGQTAEAAINGLLGWAVGLGLTDAQARAAIKSQF